MIPIVKVCGMKNADNIQQIYSLNPDWMGFIFYEKSPRNVENNLDLAGLTHIQKVGVFVNASEDEILDKIQKFQLNIVQLHGDENIDFCQKIRKLTKVIKAFPISQGFDFEQLNKFENSVDFFLFDTKVDGMRGGSGKKFDWNLLQKYQGNTPFLLSGGISEDNIEELAQLKHEQLIGFDINSKFETSPGIKDRKSVKRFISKIKGKNEVSS